MYQNTDNIYVPAVTLCHSLHNDLKHIALQYVLLLSLVYLLFIYLAYTNIPLQQKEGHLFIAWITLPHRMS